MERYCQVCGRQKELDEHHLKFRSRGGTDETENLLTLCRKCHSLVHDGRIDLSTARIITGEIPSYEEMIQRAIDCVQAEQETKWILGAICAILVGVMAEPEGKIAAALGCSSWHVSLLVKTWSAFPAENLRNPELSWSHHRYAAATENPSDWLEKASREQWSVRQLRRAIGGETIETPEQLALKKAQRAFAEVKKVMAVPGPAADYLGGELAKLFRWG